MNADLAVIGAGPGGYTAAALAAEAGLRTVLFEKDLVGGTCLNRGCIPTKALLHTAETWAAITGGDLAGITAAGLDFAAMHQKKNEIVTALRQGVESRLKTAGVTMVSGFARVIGPGQIVCGGENFSAQTILLAAGAAPALPPVPGIELPGVCTSDALLEGTPPAPESLVIIGGGVIGVESASIYLPMGIPVTILEAADRILPEMDLELSRRVAMNLKKQGARIETGARVAEVSGNPGHMTVHYTDRKGRAGSAEAALVLAATGRRADVAALFPADYCPDLQRGAAVSDAEGRTSLPGVWVIGDARAGNIQLAHVATAQAQNFVARLTGSLPPADESVVPACVYTRPAAASVGLTEAAAKAAGRSVRTLKALTGANGKCMIEGTQSGFLKLVADSGTGEVLGAQMVCPEAADLVGELSVAVRQKLTVSELAAVIHPHPAFCELIAAAAAQW